MSQIDPIWDGGDTFRQSSFTGKKDSIMWGVGMEIDPRYDTCNAANETDNSNDTSQLAINSDDKDNIGVTDLDIPQYSKVDTMKKIPSGFWDVDVSEIGAELPNVWQPSMTVL